MENRFELTDGIMEKAETYMPVLLKETISADVARVCVREAQLIRKAPDEGEEPEEVTSYGLPPVWCESTLNKSRAMLTVLMTFYLKVWDDSRPLLCDIDDFDQMMGSHVINQLERYKSTKYREKAFDILADYKDMEKRLNSAVYSVVREMNDPVTRFMTAMGEIGSTEGMEKTLELLQESAKELRDENERQERIIKGEEEAEIAEVSADE